MQLHIFSIVVAGREQTLKVRAAHVQRELDGGYELIDERGKAIAWLPGGMVIEHHVLPEQTTPADLAA